MARGSGNLRRGEQIALLVVAIAAFPAFWAFDWLKIHQPVVAMIVRALGYVGMTSFFGLCAWLSWRAALDPLTWPANQYARSIGERLAIVVRRPGALYVAIMSSIAAVLCLVGLARLLIGAI